MKPLCFVLMPFGTKTDGSKKEINFDKVYEDFIKKAIIAADLEPIRADEEKGGGFIHKPMYERLLFCDFAIADLSFANANVFYELGIRHAAKPYTTVSVFEQNTKLPFDVAALRAMPYEFNDSAVVNAQAKIDALAGLIKANLNILALPIDSPIAQLITQYKFPELNTLKSDADTFREYMNQVKDVKEKLNDIVKQWKQLDKDSKKEGLTNDELQKIKDEKAELLQKVKGMQESVGPELNTNFDLVYSFLETYKSTSAFQEVIELLKPFKENQKDNIYLQQQLALALNKVKERDESAEILTSLISKYGADPETNGLLGAVYKGMMDDNKDDEAMKEEYRTQAVDAYLEGFESDPRNYYPGVNALTLMYFSEVEDGRFSKYFPLVTYAVERQLATKKKDYWVQATALELAALEMNEVKAKKYLAAALTCNPNKWEKETTRANLIKIYDKAFAGTSNGGLRWLHDIIVKLG